ncbi:MAG: transglycosylase domain-containing protein [Neomegalonema sp.]|nr:transglycosylase domain-containing protein [Neomegalonema sp.]
MSTPLMIEGESVLVRKLKRSLGRLNDNLLPVTKPIRRVLPRWRKTNGERLPLGARVWRITKFVTVALLLLATPALAIVVFIAIPSHILPQIARLQGTDADIREFDRTHHRSHSALLYDGRGRYVGLLTADAARDRDYVTRLRGRVLWGEQVFFNDHKSVPVEDAPRYFHACLAYLEDRHRGGWDNPYGVSWTGVSKVPLSLLGLGKGGGSTLEMQLARSMWQTYPGQDKRNNTTRQERKFAEWEAAPRLRRALTADFKDESQLRRWLSQHIALAQGADKQGSVYGVEAVGMFAFGKRAAELTPAQQLVLAAAVKQPLSFRPSVAKRRDFLRSLIGAPNKPKRAFLCTQPGASYDSPAGPQKIFLDEPTRLAAAKELSTLARDYKGPYLHPELRALAKPLEKHPAGPRFGPLALSDYFLGRAATEAAAQLTDYFAAHPDTDPARHLFRGRLTAARLTLDATRNRPFTEEARTLLKSWGAKMIDARGEGFDKEVLKHLLIAAIDERGRIVRYYTSSSDTPLFGRAATRPENTYSEGPYDPSRQRRIVGSVYKVAAAMLLAEQGATNPNEIWSNACFYGITSRCMRLASGVGYRAKVKARVAFAESLNAAVARKLDGPVSGGRMREFAKSLGVEVDDPYVRASTSMALGRYRTRPLEILMLMSMARAYAEADWTAPIAKPHLITEIEAFDEAKSKKLGWRKITGASKPLTDYVRPSANAKKSAAFVRTVLSAPLCQRTTKLVRPTLRGLRSWCARRNKDVAVHLAKTGTVPGPPSEYGRNERDWWIGGAIRFRDGRAYSYVVALGPAPSGGSFARDLSSRQLAPFVELLLESLKADHY